MMPLNRSVGLAEVADGERAYVLNLTRVEDQQRAYVLEGTALEVWRHVDGTRTEAQIVDQVVEASGAEREVVARDTRSFLATLRGLGLISGDSEG